MSIASTSNNLFHRLIIFFLLGAAVIISSGISHAALTKQVIKPASYTDIQTLFSSMNYRWDNLHQGVPDIKLHSFPADFVHVSDVTQKKRLFYMSLLPMVLTQNKIIRQQRSTLQQLLQQYDEVGSITTQQKLWLQQLGKQYHCAIAPLNSKKVRYELLSRVNIVPAALVIAQAANESAYGTSRFAQLANNIFGEWTFKVGTGLVPLDRSPGKKFEVKKFTTLNESLSSYFNNINSHRAYTKLREVRQQMSAAGRPIDAQKLAECLTNYSTRRGAYVAELQSMMRYNKLDKLSVLELRSSKVELVDQQLNKDVAGTILRLSELCSRVKAKQVI